MSLLSLFLCLETDFVDIIFQALRLEFEFIIFCLEDSLGSSLLLYSLGVLNQQVILVHLGQISLLPHFHELSV